MVGSIIISLAKPSPVLVSRIEIVSLKIDLKLHYCDYKRINCNKNSPVFVQYAEKNRNQNEPQQAANPNEEITR